MRKFLLVLSLAAVPNLVPPAAQADTCDLRWQDYDQPGYRSSMQKYSTVAEYALTNRLQKLVADDKTSAATIESYLERLISITTFQSKYETALQYCDHALRLAEKDKLGSETVARLHKNRGKIYFKQGKYTQAEIEFNAAARALDPKTSPQQAPQMNEIQKALAGVYTEQKRFAEAEAIYRSSVRLHDDLQPQLAELVQKHRPEPSGRVMALDESETDRRDLVAFAKCLNAEGKYDEAAQRLLAAIELDRRNTADEDPTLAAEFNDLACVYAKQGRLAEAEQCMSTALKICRERHYTDLPEWVGNQVILLKAQGKSDEAKKLQDEVAKPAAPTQAFRRPSLL